MSTGVRRRISGLRALVWVPLIVVAGATQIEAQTKTYVVHSAANLVSVIDTATGAVTSTISVGTSPSRVVVTRDGTRAYVSNGGADSVSVIDTASDVVT